MNPRARPYWLWLTKFQGNVDAGSEYLPKNTSPNANAIGHQEEDNENLHFVTSAVTPTDSTGNRLINKLINKCFVKHFVYEPACSTLLWLTKFQGNVDAGSEYLSREDRDESDKLATTDSTVQPVTQCHVSRNGSINLELNWSEIDTTETTDGQLPGRIVMISVA